MPRPRTGAYRHIQRTGVYRSKFEAELAAALSASGVEFEYEPEWIRWDDGARQRRYRPDFKLNNGVYIEAKGRFLPEDRRRHLMLREQRPELDIRFVFQNANNRLNRTSQTTYAMWCERNGFAWAHKEVPKGWTGKRPRKPRKPTS